MMHAGLVDTHLATNFFKSQVSASMKRTKAALACPHCGHDVCCADRSSPILIALPGTYSTNSSKIQLLMLQHSWQTESMSGWYPVVSLQGAVELLPAARELIARAVDTVAPVLLKSTSASAHVVGFASLAPPEQVGEHVTELEFWYAVCGLLNVRHSQACVIQRDSMAGTWNTCSGSTRAKASF
jgi:hypothetical protein